MIAAYDSRINFTAGLAFYFAIKMCSDSLFLILNVRARYSISHVSSCKLKKVDQFTSILYEDMDV